MSPADFKVRGQTKNSYLTYMHDILEFMVDFVYVKFCGKILVFSQ